MGNAAAIIATLELTRGKFKTEVEATESDLKKVQGTVKETAAAVSVLERELQKDSGNKALKENLSTLKTSLREAEKEMKLLEQQKKRLDAALGSTPAPKPASVAMPANEPQDKPIVYDDENYTRFKGRGRGQGAGGEGNNAMAMAEAGHSVRSVLDSVGAGQSFGQSLQMELPRLLQAAGAGIGAMIGIEAATGIVGAIGRGIEKARELKKAIADALEGGGGGVGGASSGALTKQMDELAEQREKLMGPESVAGIAGRWGKNLWRSMTSPKHQTVEEENGDNIQNLEDRRILISEELVKRKAEQVALDQRASEEGEEAVAIDRERLSLKEKIQAVHDDKNMDAMAQAHMVDLLRQESAEREKHIRLTQQKQDIEDQAHHENSMDRRNGADTEVSKAQHALEEAKKKRDLLPYNSREWLAAADDITDKQADLDRAKHEQAMRSAERRDAGSVAGMTGPDAAKQRKALENERARLWAAAYDPNDPKFEQNDEKRQDIIQKQLPEVRSKLRDQDAADRQRAFQARRNEIDARTGTGTAERIKAIDDKLDLNQDEQADNAAHKKDAVVASQLTAEAAQLNREKREIEISSARELANAKAQTQEMELQQTGQSSAARIVAIRAQYEERIADALRNGKTDLAEQYRIQEKLSVQAAQLIEFRKTPMQHAQDRLAQQKDEQDLKQMAIRQLRELEAARQKYEDENRASLPAEAKARAEAIAKAVPDLNGVLDKNLGDTTTKDSAENASDAAFNARFHPNSPQPDRRPVATADPQQQHSQDDSNIGDAVDVLEEIRDILDDRLDLTIDI